MNGIVFCYVCHVTKSASLINVQAMCVVIKGFSGHSDLTISSQVTVSVNTCDDSWVTGKIALLAAWWYTLAKVLCCFGQYFMLCISPQKKTPNYTIPSTISSSKHDHLDLPLSQ